MKPGRILAALHGCALGAASCAGVGAILVAMTGRASAAPQADGSCERPRVVVSAGTSAIWRRALDEACRSLGTAPDVDPAVIVRVEAVGSALVLDATSHDGHARRTVRTPEALAKTLRALSLLLEDVPVEQPPSRVPDAVPADPLAAQAPVTVTPPPEVVGTSLFPAKELSTPFVAPLSVEIAALVSGRVARAPTYLSLGPSALLVGRAGPWQLGLALRWEGLRSLQASHTSSFETTASSETFFVGRRLAASASVELAGALSAVLLQETFSDDRSGNELTRSLSDTRAGALLRTTLGHGSSRLLLLLDGDVSPTRIGRRVRVDASLPLLPAWSLGLSLGVAWSIL